MTHVKNQPSDAPLLNNEKSSTPLSKIKNQNTPSFKRRQVILPIQTDSADTKTPEGFNLKKFIEDTEKKMNENTKKVEGRYKLN